jgi:hypothetical protein
MPTARRDRANLRDTAEAIPPLAGAIVAPVATALSAQDLRALRLQAQLLAGERASDVAAAVRQLVGLQAQSTPAARLAVRSRTAGLTRDDVDGACRDGLAVRTWAMRGTLHMLAATDVRWIIGLLGPHFTRTGTRRREQLGLYSRTCRRGLAAIERVLAGSRPLTRAELMAAIAAEGVAIDPTDQAPAHLVHHAAMQGLVCRGPEVGADEPTYVLLDEWLPPSAPVERDEALARLARRYLAGHGPATAADLATWSGLPMPDARAAFAHIAGEVQDVEVSGTPMLALASTDLTVDHDTPPRLLGRFDDYLLGYRDRDLILDPADARRIVDGGMIQAAVVVGGRIVGTWRIERRDGKRVVEARPFTTLPRGCRTGLRREVDDIGRFLGIDVLVAFVPA